MNTIVNQTYSEITSDEYLDFIKDYVVGIGPWKDTLVPPSNNYLQTPSDLVARAHARNLQVQYISRFYDGQETDSSSYLHHVL